MNISIKFYFCDFYYLQFINRKGITLIQVMVTIMILIWRMFNHTNFAT